MTSENFNTNQYNLSIRLTSDGFSLFVTDERNNLLSSKKTTFDIFNQSKEEIIEKLLQEQVLNINYQSVRIIVETDYYSCFPESMLDEDHIYDLLHLQYHQIKPTDCMKYNLLLAWNAVLAFSIPKHLNEVLTEILPEVNLEHHLYSFINDKVALDTGQNFYIWLRNQTIDIVALEKGNLILINSYDYITKEDFVYHILNAAKQLSFDREECNLSIYNSDQQPELAELAAKYFRNCHKDLSV